MQWDVFGDGHDKWNFGLDGLLDGRGGLVSSDINAGGIRLQLFLCSPHA